MYSFTSTNIHSLHALQPSQPKLLITCRCHRKFIQQQIYTCLLCPSYSCHYCTIVEFFQLQCRSCRKQYDLNNKNKCQFCFNCPHCKTVLTLAKDPQNKHYIMMCQYCWWSTKDIKLTEEKFQVLLEKMNRNSLSIKDTELKIYNHAYTFFKQSNLCKQLEKMENQNGKFSKKSIRNSLSVMSSSLSSMNNQEGKKNSQLTKFMQNSYIKRTGLDQVTQQYHNQASYPQSLPLISKKIRKCPDCSKPLTTIQRSRTQDKLKFGSSSNTASDNSKSRYGDHKIQLMHKDMKILQCQYISLKQQDNNKVKIKILKDCLINNQEYKKDQIIQVQANQQFNVKVKIQNRMRNNLVEVQYKYLVEAIVSAGKKN